MVETEELDRSFVGTVYTDGSRIHGDHPDTRRLGWSFVVLNDAGHVIAAARGSPPHYVHDVPGAEAWAILQASAFALPGCKFFSDCKPCVDALRAGRAWACSARRLLARVFVLLSDSLEHSGLRPDDVTWMPAHTSRGDVGNKLRGDGRAITAMDQLGNALADNQAKLAAGRYSISQRVVALLSDFYDQSLAALRWLGRVSWHATHRSSRLARDSEASRLQASMVKRGRATRQQPATARPDGPAASPAQPAQVATRRAVRWCLRASSGGTAQAQVQPERGRHRSHQLMRSGNTFWCLKCGAYSALRGVGLAAPCPGSTPHAAAGGRAQQLRFLKRGRHPKTGQRMAPSAPWRAGGADIHVQAPSAHTHGNAADLCKTQMGQLQLRVRERLARRLAACPPGSPPAPTAATPAPPAAAAVPQDRAATAKQKLVQRLIDAALGRPPGGAYRGAAMAPAGAAAPAMAPAGAAANGGACRGTALAPAGAAQAAKRRRLLSEPDVAAPAPLPGSRARSRPSRACPRTSRLHPALRRSSLPPLDLRVPVPLGAASPSGGEASFAPQPDLDQRLRLAEGVARAARRGNSAAAPDRAPWRPLSLRHAPLPPLVPAPPQLTAVALVQLATPLPPPPAPPGSSVTKRSLTRDLSASPPARRVRPRLPGRT